MLVRIWHRTALRVDEASIEACLPVCSQYLQSCRDCSCLPTSSSSICRAAQYSTRLSPDTKPLELLIPIDFVQKKKEGALEPPRSHHYFRVLPEFDKQLKWIPLAPPKRIFLHLRVRISLKHIAPRKRVALRKGLAILNFIAPTARLLPCKRYTHTQPVHIRKPLTWTPYCEHQPTTLTGMNFGWGPDSYATSYGTSDFANTGLSTPLGVTDAKSKCVLRLRSS